MNVTKLDVKNIFEILSLSHVTFLSVLVVAQQSQWLQDMSENSAYINTFIAVTSSFCSPGGCGRIQKSQTSGTNASMTMRQRPGCVQHPMKMVQYTS